MEFSREKLSTRPSILCDSPVSPVVQGQFWVIFFSEAIPTHAVTQHLLFLLPCLVLNSRLPALVQSLLTWVTLWVLSSLGFCRVISLGEGEGKSNSSKSQIKVGSEFISSAHKYSSKLTCYPSGQFKKPHVLL